MKTKLLYTLFIFILLISSCIKDKEMVCPTEFLLYNSKVIPYDSIYNLGDTLTLIDNFDYMVYEKTTGEYFNLKDYPFEAGLSITKVDTICSNLFSNLLDFINVIPNNKYTYSIQNFSDERSILFSTVNLDADTFRNEIKIILMSKGIYSLKYGCGSIDNRYDFVGKCRSKTYNILGYLNYGMSNNPYLLKQSPDEYFNTWFFNQIKQKGHGPFIFKVE